MTKLQQMMFPLVLYFGHDMILNMSQARDQNAAAAFIIIMDFVQQSLVLLIQFMLIQYTTW